MWFVTPSPGLGLSVFMYTCICVHVVFKVYWWVMLVDFAVLYVCVAMVTASLILAKHCTYECVHVIVAQRIGLWVGAHQHLG